MHVMLKNKCITIIDDDDLFIYLSKRTIEELNECPRIQVFNNGQDALDFFNQDLISTQIPSIIFLDLAMPILDGWQFLDEFIPLKPRFLKTDIYICSSSINPSDLERAKSYSEVNDFIIKPISRERFKWLLENMNE